MLVGIFMSRKRLKTHDLVPAVRIDLQLAAAVPANKVNALRGIGILHQDPGGAGLPYADHGDHRQHAARKLYEHKALFPDFVRLQPGIDAPGQIIELGIGDSLGMHIIKQDRSPWVHPGILLQPVNDRFHVPAPCQCRVSISLIY